MTTTPTPVARPRTKQHVVAMVVAIGAAIAAVLLFAILIRSRGSEATDATPSAAIYAAKIACKKAGDDQLPADANAQWQNLAGGFGVDLGKDHFHVQLVVEAQNGFGAFVREVADCQVTREGSSFRVRSITITSR
jgi:hypothetical protein